MLADPGAAYLIAEDSTGEIAGFAILQGLLSEHRQVELKRLVVRTPNEGVGKKLLTEAVERAFGEYHAHRIFLDVFVTNERARHVYDKWFPQGGHHARSVLLGWQRSLTGLDVVARK
jgi:RimJ/RimL family protein N-acetyltransferase